MNQNRVIKFRAFFHNEMWEVERIEWRKGEVSAVSVERNHRRDYWFDSSDKVYDAISVMQFTGLHDKNRMEIYEGDILKWDEVEWGNPHLEVCEWDYELFDMRENDWERHCEVIGNIYENPELMEADNGRS